MKIWFKIWENTHLLKSETIEDDTEDTRTHKIFHALEEVCLKWDLGKPIWFDANIAEFQRHARTRFPIRYYHITRNTFCTQKATNLIFF